MQAVHPVHSPDVTTSVNSSAHWGFSGGMRPYPSDARSASESHGGYRRRSWPPPRPGRLRPADAGDGLATLRRCPSCRRSSSTADVATRALGRVIVRRALARPLVPQGRRRRCRSCEGHSSAASFTDARRIGKVLLLDVDEGPTVGIRFGMTGNLAVDGTTGVDELRNAPHRHDPAWDRWAVIFADGGSLVVPDPRRLGGVFLDPDVSRLGPDAATLTTGSWPGRSMPRRPRSRRACSTSRG